MIHVTGCLKEIYSPILTEIGIKIRRTKITRDVKCTLQCFQFDVTSHGRASYMMLKQRTFTKFSFALCFGR